MDRLRGQAGAQKEAPHLSLLLGSEPGRLGQSGPTTAPGGSRCLQLEKVYTDLGVREGGAGWRWQPQRGRVAQGRVGRAAGVRVTPRSTKCPASSHQSTEAPCRQPRPRMPQKGDKGKTTPSFSPGSPVPDGGGGSDPGCLSSNPALPIPDRATLASS